MTNVAVGAAPSQSSVRAAVATTALAKIFVMGVSGILGVVTSRLIISNFGIGAYAQYGLIATLPSLMPFADLGISAAVLNAVSESDDPAADGRVRKLIVSALRIMIVSGTGIAALALAIGIAGWWPNILGDGLLPHGGAAASACLVLFGAALPLSIGPRILIGLGRNALQVTTQAIAAPFIFAATLLSVTLGLGVGNFVAAFTYLATALTSAACLLVVRRTMSNQLRRAVREVPHLRRVPSVRVMNVAWPMLVQMLALPVAMQTDRILLSHLTGPTEVAQYNLASQLFGLVLQTIATAGLALWPIFARDRARGAKSSHSPFALMYWFVGCGVALALGLAVALPFVVGLVSNGAIAVSPLLAGAFVFFIAAQAAKYPLGMYMTDERGLRFQVLPILLMAPINLALSWSLVGTLGAAGPIVGSAVSVVLCQVIPCSFYVHRDIRAER